MADIHRLLCTHCTFGTSELESSSADNAGKVLGYSVRKSSISDGDRGQLRQVFRAVERLLSYGLPKDATAAHKETLSADTAPRRLIFFPNLGGWQVAGQVSYRTFDTSQPPRPGSYFADLIVAKAPDPRSRDPEPAWSPCDVLQLWGVGPDRKTRDHAGWWISSEDELAAAESDGPWKPPAPSSVAAVREPHLPLLDDAAAYRFLSANAVVTDPLVPARWWAMPAERRRELVAHMLQATIQGPARGGRETVTIAAEPSVAAVLFYIVCRLLPRRIAAGVSFSTYEPAPERPLTGLVATTFLDEEAPTADLPPELAQRGFACNTFRDASNYGRCQPPPEQGYAWRLVALAAANDWDGIDSLLTALDTEGLKAADLDQLIKIDHLLTAYFGGEKPTGFGACRGPQEVRFLRERFRGVLETQAATRADWPSDLVEAAIVCLEGELESLWTAAGPVRDLLERHLPDGEGLKRLLKPPQGIPAAPRALVVAAVGSATLRGKPPRLPSSFVQHCREAREGRNRADAVDVLRDVIRGLPEDRQSGLLAGIDSASFTDLLLDAARDLSPPERDGLRPVLTESLSKVIEKHTAKDPAAAADLLYRQADAAVWISASHHGLPQHLDKFFRTVLSDTAPNIGCHLLDAAGRSRVAKLQQWAAHAGDHVRIGQTLTHWNSLHDSLARLAANAPAWRSWAKPAAPEGREIPAAIAAIEGLRPFDLGNPIKARQRQQGLAKTVVQTFKQAQPEGSDLRAGWETVGHWLDRALAEEADRNAPGPGGAGSGLPTVAIYGVAAGITAVIATLGLWGYSQRALDDLLPQGWRRGEGPATVASTDRGKTPTGESGDKPQQDAPAASTIPAAGVSHAPPTPDKPELPLTAADVNLQLQAADGVISVNWNHGDLKDRIKDTKLTWTRPDNTDPQPLTFEDGSAQIDTKGHGFGQYEVKLSVAPSAGNGEPFDKTVSASIDELPQIQVTDTTIEIRDGKLCLRVKVTPLADKKHYGDVSYQLTGPSAFPQKKKASDGGTVVFELPNSVTPANYPDQLLQFNLATVVPQGPGPAVNLPPIPPPDPKPELLDILKEKQHITALAENPGKEPQPLFEIPWSLGPEQLELQLMTPEFKPGRSLLLGPKDTNSKTPRWRCTAATISLATGDTEAAQVLVGDFEVEAKSPWQPRLLFRPAQNQNEKGYDNGYEALRCCRLCLVIAGQPVATCQMRPVQTVGRLKLSLPEGDKERQLQKVAAPRCCNQPQLVFDAEQTRRGGYGVRADVYNKARRLLLTQQDVPLTQAGLEFNNGIPTMTKTKWALDGARKKEDYDSTDKSQKESDLDRRTKFLTVCDRKLEALQTEKVSLENLMESKAKEEDKNSKRPRLVALRQTLIPGEEQARSNVQAIIEKLQNDLDRIAEIKALNDIHFILDEWSITVDTTLQHGTKPLHDGNALETTVVLVKGSAKDPPLAFVAPPQAKDPDLPKPDAP